MNGAARGLRLALRRNPLVQLTMARLREFAREPEAVFWVFVFPVLLTLALGIAFRDPDPATGERYIEFLLPGLVGLNIMGSGMWGIGFPVVQARRQHLLKRFRTTPMRRADFLAAYGLSRLLFLVAEVIALFGFGWLFFDVAVRGSWIALAVVCLAGSLGFQGLGLLVAARPRSVEVVSGWMNFVMLPMWLLSGTFYDWHRFPAWLHPAIRILPLTALNDALRAVANHGAGLGAVLPETALLLAWGGACFVLAVRLFRWT